MSARPRLAFLGVGWIGRDRMRAIAAEGVADIVAIADTDPAAAAEAAAETGATAVLPCDVLTSTDLDGLVIATPSALHAQQAVAALDAGLAVFCQKPLGRTAGEARAVVDAARRADRLLGVDLSYRHLEATQRMRDVIAAGGIGQVFAADISFHNAYGPDKPWFLDRELSGGGCVIDLGTHLVDLALWMLHGESLSVVASSLYAAGHEIVAAEPAPAEQPRDDSSAAPTLPVPVEDYATALLRSSTGTAINLSCSWFLHAGRDAVINATFYGTEGAVALANVAGSFYDFEARLHRSTSVEVLVTPPDPWSGRAAVEWARALADDRGAGPPCAGDDLVAVSTIIDGIYGR